MKEKRGHFLYNLLCLKEIFLRLCFISMYSVLNTLAEYTYLLHIQKRLLQTLLLLGSKIVEILNVSLIVEEN